MSREPFAADRPGPHFGFSEVTDFSAAPAAERLVRCFVVDPVSAIVNCNFEAAEALRGSLSRQQVSDIVALYRDTSDWGQKDIAVHLLQDCEPSTVEVVMRDALHSPTTETRAVAFCSLKNDFGRFEKFLRNGFVDAALVDEAIRSEFGT